MEDEVILVFSSRAALNVGRSLKRLEVGTASQVIYEIGGATYWVCHN